MEGDMDGSFGKLMVLSPHLDDAVFSCGALLAAQPGTVVVTAFAGAPSGGVVLAEWDATAGFDAPRQAIAARREEDRQALQCVQATPHWLDFCDSQYGPTPWEADLAAAFDDVVRQYRPDTVLMPAGLFHSDHALAHRAALRVRRKYAGSNWLMYEEAFYRRIPGLLQRRLAVLLDAGLHATPLAYDTSGHVEAKRAATAFYASQLRALASAGRPGHVDLDAPERYWQLTQI